MENLGSLVNNNFLPKLLVTYGTQIMVCTTNFIEIQQLTWYVRKHHMACKNIIYVLFLNARNVNLNWSLEVIFANYNFSSKVRVHSTRLVVDLALEKKSHVNVRFS